MTDKEYGFTLEDIKRIEGIEVIKNNNFPITVWDKEKNFTDDYVKYLAEKICDMINEDIQSGLTGKYEEELYEE